MAAVVVAAHHMRAGEGQVLDAADQVITTDFGQENAASIHVPDSARKKVERSPLLSVQRRMLSNMKNRASGARLHASNLADRLLFESSLVRGVFRLVNQALVFSLMLIALSLAGDPSAKRGIYNNLKDTFDFDGLRDMRSPSVLLPRAAVLQASPMITRLVFPFKAYRVEELVCCGKQVSDIAFYCAGHVQPSWRRFPQSLSRPSHTSSCRASISRLDRFDAYSTAKTF